DAHALAVVEDDSLGPALDVTLLPLVWQKVIPPRLALSVHFPLAADHHVVPAGDADERLMPLRQRREAADRIVGFVVAEEQHRAFVEAQVHVADQADRAGGVSARRDDHGPAAGFLTRRDG